MKHTILFSILLALTTILKSQELSLNKTNSLQEYTHVKDLSETITYNSILTNLESNNYQEIKKGSNKIEGNGFTSYLVSGFANVEIYYKVKILFKEDRYKLILTSFELEDKNGRNKLEKMGAFKKSWIKKINKQLPEIINNIEATSSTDDW